MPKRPLPVTIVAIIVLVLAAMNFMSLMAIRQDPSLLSQVMEVPAGADFSRAIPIAMVACAVVFLIGIGVLRGLNWARISVVALAIMAALMALIQGSSVMLMSALIHVVMAYLLYRPDANAFFAYKRDRHLRPAPEAERPHDDDNGGPASGSGGGSIAV